MVRSYLVDTLVGAPAYVVPSVSDTLLGANAVCKLGDIMLHDKKILCVRSNESTQEQH